MSKQLAELVTSLIFLARDTRENKEAVARLRKEIHELTSLVEKLSLEVRHVSDREKGEREKALLQLENALLRFERRLPSAKPPKDRG